MITEEQRKILAQNLRRLRGGISREQLAKESGVSVWRIRQLEDGNADISPQEINDLHHAFGCRIVDLFRQARELKHVRFRIRDWDRL